jgi:hypothetical protein
MLFSGDWRKVIHEKNLKKKSRYTVTGGNSSFLTTAKKLGLLFWYCPKLKTLPSEVAGPGACKYVQPEY